ncbi:SAM-dependent methyltransferase [Candidatus Mancarchaeum acidiphilum]|uniref:SAM-dependent methyltransferase n=1 Tax=Candidatus Mancarchaeum acidiphilum TaxID=1920749 RepID=A0A218NMC4_9ARCH|nr:hypothetical protein [Candidatus Mancarchaeum acidiphilum]ASI13625.1 SAM-dependent methyltransferase [Candidatus Mancarchaeum acidiphilum]
MGKYYCHWFSPEELVHEFKIASKKAKFLELSALEGLATPSIEEINNISKDRKAWKNWLSVHYKLCTKSEVVGVSIHILLIGRKSK